MADKPFGSFLLRSEEIPLTHKEKKGETTYDAPDLNPDGSQKKMSHHTLLNSKGIPIRVWWSQAPSDEEVEKLIENYS